MRRSSGIAAAFIVTALAAGPVHAADDGQALFQRYCSVCHDTSPGKNKVGPSLAGVAGRESGTAPDFDYSEGMQSAHLTWDDQTLDQYLADPRTKVPGNKMYFPGIKDPDQRKAIIAYLDTLKS